MREAERRDQDQLRVVVGRQADQAGVGAERLASLHQDHAVHLLGRPGARQRRGQALEAAARVHRLLGVMARDASRPTRPADDHARGEERDEQDLVAGGVDRGRSGRAAPGSRRRRPRRSRDVATPASGPPVIVTTVTRISEANIAAPGRFSSPEMRVTMLTIATTPTMPSAVAISARDVPQGTSQCIQGRPAGREGWATAAFGAGRMRCKDIRSARYRVPTRRTSASLRPTARAPRARAKWPPRGIRSSAAR